MALRKHKRASASKTRRRTKLRLVPNAAPHAEVYCKKCDRYWPASYSPTWRRYSLSQHATRTGFGTCPGSGREMMESEVDKDYRKQRGLLPSVGNPTLFVGYLKGTGREYIGARAAITDFTGKEIIGNAVIKSVTQTPRSFVSNVRVTLDITMNSGERMTGYSAGYGMAVTGKAKRNPEEEVDVTLDELYTGGALDAQTSEGPITCLQYVSEFPTAEAATTALEGCQELENCIGGRVYTDGEAHKAQVFLQDDPNVSDEQLPEGMKRVVIPEGQAAALGVSDVMGSVENPRRRRRNGESWSINTTEWVGYSEKHPEGTKLVQLVPFKTYASYNAAYDAARAHANRLGKTVYLGNATPYQIAVPSQKGKRNPYGGHTDPDRSVDHRTAFMPPVLKAREALKLIRAEGKKGLAKGRCLRLSDGREVCRDNRGYYIVGAKRNPEGDVDNAADLYESFHGRPSSETLEYKVQRHEHEDFGGIGALISLEVKTQHGKYVTITSADPEKANDADIVQVAQTVTQDADGNELKQLHFIGGDQELDLDALGFKSADIKDTMLIGTIMKMTYQTEKGFDEFELTDYFHKLGEDTGVKPILLYDPISKLMSMAGGQYDVAPEGIKN